MKLRLNYDNAGVPEHTAESLENYLFRGYEPGGFLFSVLSNDLIGACTRCDFVNRNHIVEIIKFIMYNLPGGSWGDPESVSNWINDKNGVRTEFVTIFEKRLMWQALTSIE